MPWSPDRVGPSLALYLRRWDDMVVLTKAVEDDEPHWELSPEDRQRAEAVVAAANAQAETLLYRCVEEGVEPALGNTIAFSRPPKLRGKIAKYWWTGPIELRPRGPGRPRPIGWIELEIKQVDALLVYVSLEGADGNNAVSKLMNKLAGRGPHGTKACRTEDGFAVYTEIKLREGDLFADVIKKVADLVTQVVVKPWPSVVTTVRKT